MSQLPPLIDQPDWPDRSQWYRSFHAQVLCDVEGTQRSHTVWNDAEERDLMRQVQDDVQLVEIARRHQRYVYEIEDRRKVLLSRMERKLLE